MKKEVLKKQKAITLIALVITIIVLLILAGVSISMILGQEGIFNKAKVASEQTRIEGAKEAVQLATTSSYGEKGLDYGKLEVNLKKVEKIDKSTVPSPITSLPITVTVDGIKVTIDGKGKVTNEEEMFEKAEKHPDQSASNNDIGIAEDGAAVNLDLWNYTLIDNTIHISGELNGCNITPSYVGDIIDGKIIGEVPMYIKIAGQDKFYPVTELYYTFNSLKNLLYAPSIPSTVVSMKASFYNCNSLTKAPEIPNGVESINNCFRDCFDMQAGPSIIPASVKDMRGTFERCESLTGEIIINANPTNFNWCFEFAVTNEGCHLIVKGDSPILDEIIATKTEGSNITKGN